MLFRSDDASRGLLAGMQCSDRRVAVHRAHKRDKLLRLAGINKAHCSEMLSWMGCEGCDGLENRGGCIVDRGSPARVKTRRSMMMMLMMPMICAKRGESKGEPAGPEGGTKGKGLYKRASLRGGMR